MGKGITRLTAALLLAVALLYAQEADAQFFQKLSKGLDKVNETLEKVEEGIEDVNKGNVPSSLFKKKQSSEKATNSNSVDRADEEHYAEATIDDSDFEEVEPTYHRPYIGPNTKYMIIDDLNSYSIGPVNDDIFSIKQGNYYSFWRVDGTKLFNADWEYCNERKSYGAQFPEFNSGVVAARHRQPNSTGKRVISLLYLDGSVRELDPAWRQVTTFCDGLALVTAGSGYGSTKYFYIDIKGEKQFPNLEVYGNRDDAMRPLCDGLRAYSATYKSWGFIDAKGNIVIEPKYISVGNFSEGYAWVKDETSLMLIDTTGKVIFTETNIYASATPVKDGRFFLLPSSNSNYILYDLTGKRYTSFSTAMPFRDGYAVVAPDASSIVNPVWIINTNGDCVRKLDGPNEGHLDGSVRFSKHGIAPIEIKWGDYALINPRGDYLLRSYYRIDGYTDCGYSIIHLDDDYGIIDLKGEIVWIFSKKEVGNWESELLEPEPSPIKKPQPLPWPPEEIDPRMPPEGPKDVIATKYKVTVDARPAEGGSAHVSPSGEFGYGDEAMLHVSPAEGWEVASISTTTSQQGPKEGELFRVTKSMDIIVKFIKKDDDLPPPFDGALVGQRTFQMEGFAMPVDIYAEMSTEPNIATPYGENTYGFIVAMFNPRQRLVTKDLSTYIFAAPLRISAYHVNPETGERWLVADGGSFTLGDLKITPEDGFAMLWVNMVMAANDNTSPELTPRHYRIEMIDYDEETGEFTCGRLQTYSAEYGWLEGGDKRLEKKKKGMFMTSSDSGIPVDFFMGAKMKKTTKRDNVEWYPPVEWYDGDESILNSIVNSMKFMYGDYKSEYDAIFY